MAIYRELACSFLLLACASSSLAVCDSISALAQASLKGRVRSLLQDDSDVNDFSDLAEDSTQFEEVSMNSNLTNRFGTATRFGVALASSIETDAGATFADNFLIDNRATWEAGQTRINISVTLTPPSGGAALTTLPGSVTAQLHDLACTLQGGFSAATLYNQTSTNVSTEATFPITISEGLGTFSTVLPYLIDYDSAQSLVLSTANEGYIACVAMTPPLPDFPDEWSATVEANIVNKGYSFSSKQYYSASQNKVRLDLHSNKTDKIIISDFTNNIDYFLSGANDTYPHGYCSSRPTPNFATARFTDDSNTTLLTTAQFLRFNVDRADTVFVPGHVDVRGIPCERWVQTANATSDSSAQYNTSFYFPISQWLTAREDYHRLLAQVQLTGTRNGSNISHFYNFVNFRARNQSAAIFDPCMIAPQGANCNCTGPQASNVLQQQSSELQASLVDGVVIDPTAAECLNGASASASTKGFTHRQAGPYALFAFVGLAAGVILSVAVNFIWNTLSGGGQGLPGGNIGNHKFQTFVPEGPHG